MPCLQPYQDEKHRKSTWFASVNSAVVDFCLNWDGYHGKLGDFADNLAMQAINEHLNQDIAAVIAYKMIKFGHGDIIDKLISKSMVAKWILPSISKLRKEMNC